MIVLKKKLTQLCIGLATLGFCAMANAALPGYYVGGQLGWADTNYSSGDLKGNASVSPITSAGIDDTGIAGRIYGGYQFNQFWGAELGYDQFSNTEIKHINGINGLNATIKEYAIDLQGKGTIPISDSFGLFGKAGLAYQKINTDNPLSGNPGRINPAFGAGMAYNFTPNFSVDVAWNHIQKWGGPIPSTDMFTGGVGYNFG